MPQEASKISDPEATAAAAEEVIAESSKDKEAHVSEDESEDEATETVEGATGATEKKKKSRKRKIKDAISGKGKAPEVTDLNAPAAGQLGKDQMSMLLDANPALKNAQALEAIADPDFQTELGQFNLEINVSPKRLKIRGFSDFEETVRTSLNAAEDKARQVDARLVMIGILPTLSEGHRGHE